MRCDAIADARTLTEAIESASVDVTYCAQMGLDALYAEVTLPRWMAFSLLIRVVSGPLRAFTGDLVWSSSYRQGFSSRSTPALLAGLSVEYLSW